jgi:hypothetical protein
MQAFLLFAAALCLAQLLALLHVAHGSGAAASGLEHLFLAWRHWAAGAGPMVLCVSCNRHLFAGWSAGEVLAGGVPDFKLFGFCIGGALRRFCRPLLLVLAG